MVLAVLLAAAETLDARARSPSGSPPPRPSSACCSSPFRFPGNTSSSALRVLGVAALLLYRSYRKKNPGTFEQPNLNQRGLQYIGSELVLVEPIEQGSGKAKLGDGVWKVSGPELPAGARVRVTGVNGTILTVIPA